MGQEGETTLRRGRKRINDQDIGKGQGRNVGQDILWEGTRSRIGTVGKDGEMRGQRTITGQD